MQTLGLTWSPLLVGGLVVLFVVISLLLLVIVLLQRPQGGGLSEAFGASSAGAGNTAFGARVGDALTTATIVIFLAFLVTAVVLNWAVKPPENLAENVASSTDDGTQAPDGQQPAQDGTDGSSTDSTTSDNTIKIPEQGATLKTNQGVELKRIPAPVGIDAPRPADKTSPKPSETTPPPKKDSGTNGGGGAQ